MALDERDIERLAPELGARAAAGVDADAVARQVLARLRTAPRERWSRLPWWRRWGFVPVAAAAALAVVIGLGLWPELNRPDGQAGVPAPVVLEELAAAELSEVADSLALEAPIGEILPASLDALSEEQLELLLERMEG